MSNFFDYILWRGDIRFSQDGLNEIDALIFAEMVYVEFDKQLQEKYKKNKKLATVAEQYENNYNIIPENTKSDSLIRYSSLLKLMGESNRFSQVYLSDYVARYDVDKATQFGAITVKVAKDQYVVAFRGTDDTLAGWREDFDLCYKIPVPSQTLAAQYLEKVMTKYPGRFVVCGHSKGGNLAVYATIMQQEQYQDRIDRVYSFDGPGFFEEITKQPNYIRMVDKFENYMPQQSIVGMIMCHGEKMHVVNSDAHGLSQHNPINWKLVGPHFELQDRFTNSSTVFNNMCKKWVTEISQEERELFINLVFDILSASDALTVTEFKDNVIRNLNTSLKSYRNLDKTTRKMARGVLGQMIKLGTGVIKEKQQVIE